MATIEFWNNAILFFYILQKSHNNKSCIFLQCLLTEHSFRILQKVPSEWLPPRVGFVVDKLALVQGFFFPRVFRFPSNRIIPPILCTSIHLQITLSLTTVKPAYDGTAYRFFFSFIPLNTSTWRVDHHDCRFFRYRQVSFISGFRLIRFTVQHKKSHLHYDVITYYGETTKLLLGVGGGGGIQIA